MHHLLVPRDSYALLLMVFLIHVIHSIQTLDDPFLSFPALLYRVVQL